YYDSLKTIHGCDSVFRLVLRVYPTYLKEEKQELCSGERYQWRGRMLQAGGTYTDSLKTIHGCDSIFRLHLMVHPVYRMMDTVEICQGERHNWRGRSSVATGLYTDSLKTVHGCDSLFVLQLYVRPTYLMADTLQTCDNRPLIWHGRQLAATGTYYDSLRTVHGCDSVFRLTLTVYPTYLTADTVALCENELPYTWHGRPLQAEGDYVDSLLTADGCDSVCRFRLIVHPVYLHAFADTICEGTPYNRYGFVLSADSTTGVPQLLLTDSLRSAEGCDSVVTLALQIRILPKEMLPIHGDTLVSHEGTFMYYTDTVAGIDSYAWEVIPQSIAKTVSANKVWLEFDKTAFGWDTLVLVGRHQCGQTSPQYLPIHVTIGLAVEQVTQQEGVRLFPNPTQGSVTLELRSYESWENPRWMLCDMQGRLLESGTVESMQTHIRLDALPRGVYMVRVVSAGSRQCSMKVVKY
ncbi:MAG: T9SS type A sorting domain-containing protein, partial [Bacteroidales bacterium]|nr:T9SS type A sorting domain-containing protein [Bacteroidales bacterium]